MTTNVKLRGQLVNYAKALRNYIKSHTEIPRHASTATASLQAAANLLVYSFSPVLILVNLFYFCPS